RSRGGASPARRRLPSGSGVAASFRRARARFPLRDAEGGARWSGLEEREPHERRGSPSECLHPTAGCAAPGELASMRPPTSSVVRGGGGAVALEGEAAATDARDEARDDRAHDQV